MLEMLLVFILIIVVIVVVVFGGVDMWLLTQTRDICLHLFTIFHLR